MLCHMHPAVARVLLSRGCAACVEMWQPWLRLICPSALQTRNAVRRISMQLDIKAKNFELTDAIRAFVDQKLSTLDAETARFGEAVRAEVEVGKTTRHHVHGPYFRAEVHVRLPGKQIYADCEHEDLYPAITGAVKEAERQILTYKEKLSDKDQLAGRDAKGE